MSVIWAILVALLVFICIVATAAGLPGNYAMMLVLPLFGWLTDFAWLGSRETAWLVGALLLGEVIEAVAGMIGASRARASRRTQWWTVGGGILGGLVGSAFIPIVGSLVGLLAGVFAAAFISVLRERRDALQAREVAWSATVAQLVGTVTKLVIAVGVWVYLVAVLLMQVWQ